MSFLSRWSILTKLIVAFSVVLLFTAGLGIFSLTRIDFVTTVAQGLEANIAGTTPIEAMGRAESRLFGFASEAVMTKDPARSAELVSRMKTETDNFNTNWQIYEPTMDPGRETGDGDGFQAAFQQMSQDAATAATNAAAGNLPAAEALITGPMAQLNDTFNARLVDDLAYQAMMAANHGTSIEGAKSSSKVSITIALAVMMVVVCGLVWALISSIGRPITRLTNTMRQLAEGKLHTEVAGTERHDEIGGMAQAVQVFKDAGLEKIRLESDMEAARHRAEEERRHREMERDAAAREQENIVNSLAIGLAKLAEGDLVFRLNTPFGADYEKLRNDFNNAMNQMHETMKVILNNASNIRAGTGEIAEAADDLSRRTEQQAASLEQTAAALDEITATVRRTAEGASHAHEVVASTQSDAERSGGVVRDAVAAMSEIETSSQQISNIIGVIDEIAFQTNLLALNAGVEAARAGDAGRGFAVVASEVRALAQRSADAAKEIKSLISASTRQVVSGVDLVGQTGTALARIVSQIGEISGVVSQIAASAQEQATGLHQVNAAINQMDQVTQQNAAMVEESTAACHSLAQETEKLVTLTARFQIGEAHNAAHNVAHAPTRKREPQKRFNGVLKPVLAAAGDFANSMDMEEF